MRLTAYILLIYFFTNAAAWAQQNAFPRIDSIPVLQNGMWLKNPWAGGLSHPIFSQIDLNNDGVKDLFVFDMTNNRIECFINKGIPDSVDYQFSSAYAASFPFLHDWAFLRDYNCDDKEDIFALSDNFSYVKVYRNVSSGGGLNFQLVTSKLTMTHGDSVDTVRANTYIYPAFIDVDNDGDLDILNYSANQPRMVEYYANKSEENGWHCDSLAFNYETGCWGNFVLCSGTGSANAVCNFNISCREMGKIPSSVIHYDPSDAARLDDSLTNLFAFDANGDGAKDLLIGDLASTNTLLVINGGTPGSANMVSQDQAYPSYNLPVNMPFPGHAYLDVDNDGKSDLLVSSSSGNNINDVWFYKNDSTTAAPKLSLQSTSFLQDQMIDVGEGCYPVFFDYDNDGKQDLFIGNNIYIPELNSSIGTALALYKNIGSDTSPAFQLIDPDFGGLSASAINGPLSSPIYPAFADLNGDGKPDLIIGNGDGSLTYFVNTAATGQPASFAFSTANYMGIHVGQAATPQFIDLNRDGLPDLVIGSRTGYVKYYQNTGTVGSANFSSTPTIDSLGKANTSFHITGGYAVPFIYDDNGAHKMFLAGEEGYVLHFDDIDNNLHGVFNLTDTIIKKGTEGIRLSVSGTDLNKDGKIDLIVGNYSGGAGIFSQNLPLSVKNIPTIKPSIEFTPNPANNFFAIHVYNFNASNAEICITDMLGRTVKKFPVSIAVSDVDISGLSNGIYIVELQSEKFNVSKKLIIQHQ